MYSKEKSVFVTVGTTLFDDLIKTVASEEVLQCLLHKGYSKVTLQIGKGEYIPVEGLQGGIDINYYRYKPSLQEDLQSASLVISHAGAGSCMETLNAGKPMISVVNEKLMGNHQAELAEALSKEHFCQWCYPSSLLRTLEDFDAKSLRKYDTGQPSKFSQHLDSVFITC